jgi:hypothetical protein
MPINPETPVVGLAKNSDTIKPVGDFQVRIKREYMFQMA